MARISSSIGLTTGLDIQNTVDQLVKIQSGRRDALVSRTNALSTQKTEVIKLETLLIGLQFTTNRLATSSLYQQRTVTSSNDSLLSATTTKNPRIGAYQFTPIQQAQAQQLQSSRFSSSTAALGAGNFSFRFGGFVDAPASLDLLDAGQGVSRGKIRITDRSGASAEIDLSYAQTTDDVLSAINNNSTINVRAEAYGDSFRLIDETGQTTSNLKVQEVGSGTTAASLGLSSIDVAANQAIGQDIIRLFDDLRTDKLNGGNGVRVNGALADLKITFRDGTESQIDLHRISSTGTLARGTTDALFGTNSAITFTAVDGGSAGVGINVSFIDDPTVTAGEETVVYNEAAKSVTFRIDAGHTTANQVIQALNRDTTASAVLTAARATGGNGTGLVDASDNATTAGPRSTATSLGSLTPNAKVSFTAVTPGIDFDDVAISFVADNAVTAGQETVTYDDSDPDNKKLIFHIDPGNTTADNIVAALNNDPTASAIFTAARAVGSDGSGIISINDGATTDGGDFIEPVTATSELTLGAILDVLNAAAPGNLQAAIGPDGDRLVLTDLTTDNGGTFTITQLNDSQAAEDLGFVAAASGDTLTGRRLLGGLKTSLLSTLNGGAGLGTLGEIDLTDRSGATATIDLSDAETLDDVIEEINNSGLGITARINDARNGIVLTDTTGQTASNLIVANGDGTNSADKLGITVDAASTTTNSGGLKLQVVSENTTLASLNGGAGVQRGSFQITDTNGLTRTLSLTTEHSTMGDVIDEINHLGLSLTARINDAGDGIVLVDTAHGGGDLKVTPGSGTTASDLHLTGDVETVDINGTPTQVINASTTYTIAIEADDSLEDLIEKVNALGGGVQASILNDGSTVKPYRFTLFSQQTSAASAIQWDTTATSFTLSETVKAQNALLLVGAPGTGGLLGSSSTNTFDQLLPDVNLTVKGASTTPITVTVGSSNSTLTSVLQSVVDNYNSLILKIKDVTKFDSETNARGVLQGDSSTLRIQSELSNLVSGRIFGAGSIQSFQSLGIQFKDDGTLTFVAATFQEKFDADPTAIQDFLSKSENGVSDRFKKLIDQLAGIGSSLLVNQAAAIDDKINTNNDRIEFLNARLDALRERLLLQFQRSEVAIGKIKNNLNALTSISQLAATWSGVTV